MRLEKSSFSYLVDLLDTKKLIEKVEVEDDRRKKTIKLTLKGSEVIKNLQIQHHDFMQDRLSIFTSEELSELSNAVKIIEKLIKKLPNEPRKHQPPHLHHGKD